jgi:hypothetical protein
MESKTIPSKSDRIAAMRQRKLDARPHFDVTCVAGRVYLDQDGDHTPWEAAMLLIANHTDGGSGEYTFPAPQGGTVRVTVAVEMD